MTEKQPFTGERDATDVSACTCANLRKVSRAVSQAYDDALRPVGLKATQFTLLATLERSGALPLTQLAEALVMDRTTLTRNLKPLMAKGLIQDGTDSDQRVRRIVITASGEAQLAEALPLWEAAQSRLVAGLGRKRWTRLLDDLSATLRLQPTS